jgi:hypothetical protein
MGKLVVVKPYVKKIKAKNGAIKLVAVKPHAFIKKTPLFKSKRT